MDGANLNAILGRFKPGEAGFDVMHFNVAQDVQHAARRRRPGRRARRRGRDARCRSCRRPGSSARRRWRVPARAARRAPDLDRPAALVRRQHRRARPRVRLHLRAHGGRGLREVSATTPSSRRTTSRRGWRGTYDIPYDRACKHEFVASAASHQEGDRRPDARHRQAPHRLRLPPADDLLPADRRRGRCSSNRRRPSRSRRSTPSRTRSSRSPRRRATTPELVHDAPHDAPVRRLDEATAARQPNLRWRPMAGAETPCPD